jgi:hypothetical protein
MVRYAFAVDEAEEEEFQRIFTDDAVIDGPWGKHEGVEGVKRFAKNFPRLAVERKNVKGRHLMTNFLIDGDGDSATMKVYFVEFKTDTSPSDPSRATTSEVLSTGKYDCLARKVDGAWRLQQRLLTMDAAPARA